MSSRKQGRGGRRTAPSKVTKQVVDNNVVAMMAPMRASRMRDPLPVVETIRLTKRIQIILDTPASGSELVTPVVLMTGVPGGLTYWRNCRIERIDVFSNSAPSSVDTLRVTCAADAAWNQTTSEWVDTGIPGQVRAHVGFRLGLLDRARWFSTADTTPLCAVSVDIGPNKVIVQATVELQSNFTT